jgi:hypothetical protein
MRVWNAFLNKDDPSTVTPQSTSGGWGGGRRPDRTRISFGGEKTISGAIYTRMALDVATMRIQHVKVDENDRYLGPVKSGLNECLSISANIDQTGTAFLLDAALSLFIEGYICIAPIDTTADPTFTDGYDVNTLRVGSIKQWYPAHVLVDLYNERTGQHQELTLPKRMVAIVENPLYNVMNEPNSTLKRLISKLDMLDVVDAKQRSSKLDLLIQLPYLLKTAARKKQADDRRAEIEDQLHNSELGIAYTDATEKVIQLNRPVENNLMPQIEYLTSMLYSQLGLTTSVMDGTADEATMINYYKRTVEPVTNAIVESMNRTFISKTARTQGQKLMTFSDPFKLVPMSALAEISDKFTRNEILSANEIRGSIGFKPSNQKKADMLQNSNMPQPLDPASLPQLPPMDPADLPQLPPTE